MDRAAEVLRSLRGRAFALLARADDDGAVVAEIVVGDPDTAEVVADLHPGDGVVVALLPFRQLRERGIDCHDDGAELRVIRADRVVRLPLSELLAAAPPEPVALRDVGFTESDADYAETVRAVRDEDLDGPVTHCLVRRDLDARVERRDPAEIALRLFADLVRAGTGAPWVFAVSPGNGEVLAGASPQPQVLHRRGVTELRPTCGTYRYPAWGPDREGLARFLDDDKEFEELGATVDAELATLCDLDPTALEVDGPVLLPMRGLAHTACRVRAHGVRDPLEALAGTMFASTAIGAPVHEACRVIRRRERSGRGYYGGAVALLEATADGPELDAAALIRTVRVRADHLRLSVGATIGPGSDPDAEAAETRVKADVVLRALDVGPARPRHAATAPALPDPGPVLDRRRAVLTRRWSVPGDLGDAVVLVDLGDPSVGALVHLLRTSGRAVVRLGPDHPDPVARARDAGAAVVLGPGPAVPGSSEPLARRAADLAAALLEGGLPVVGIGLGFAALALTSLPGATVVARPTATPVRDGAGPVAVHGHHGVVAPPRPGIHAQRDDATGVLLWARTPTWSGTQIRPESVLNPGGPALLDGLLTSPIGR